MSGPATKMQDALAFISINICAQQHCLCCQADATYAQRTLDGITSSVLETMDAAAAVEDWAGQHEAQVDVQMRAILMDRSEEDLDVLLAAALRLVVQRRKEEGHE